MNYQKGYYSLVQFCPDLSRHESINIGVVVYSATTGRLVSRISDSNRRIRQVFGQQDWNFLDRARQSVQSSLLLDNFETVQDLERYIAKRANVIQLTLPRPVKIADVEQEASALFDRLVGREAVPRKPRITTYLSRKLVEAGVAGLMKKSVTVKVAGFEQPMRVPYGYQNGRFNLLLPIQFNSDREDILTKAGKSALEGELLYQHPDPQLGSLQLVVLARFAEQGSSSSGQRIKDILEKRNVKFHSFANMEKLVADIKESARNHG